MRTSLILSPQTHHLQSPPSCSSETTYIILDHGLLSPAAVRRYSGPEASPQSFIHNPPSVPHHATQAIPKLLHLEARRAIPLEIA